MDSVLLYNDETMNMTSSKTLQQRLTIINGFVNEIYRSNNIIDAPAVKFETLGQYYRWHNMASKRWVLNLDKDHIFSSWLQKISKRETSLAYEMGYSEEDADFVLAHYIRYSKNMTLLRTMLDLCNSFYSEHLVRLRFSQAVLVLGILVLLVRLCRAAPPTNLEDGNWQWNTKTNRSVERYSSSAQFRPAFGHQTAKELRRASVEQLNRKLTVESVVPVTLATSDSSSSYSFSSAESDYGVNYEQNTTRRNTLVSFTPST